MLAKLVRDGVPDMIRANGEIPVVKVAKDGEFVLALREKLLEEVGEVMEVWGPKECVDELVDVLEVVYALAKALGVSREVLEEVRLAKALSHGGFEDRVIWWGNVS